MRRQHIESLRPVCPACQVERGEANALAVTITTASNGDDLIEGALQCGSCLREYPVLDGIPLLVPDVQAYIATQLRHLTRRADLSAVSEGFLVEGSGPGSPLDVDLTHLSSYSWDHYGEFDPERLPSESTTPGSVVRALEEGLDLIERSGDRSGASLEAPILEVGCAAGRASFELARTHSLVIGVDLGFHLLRVAARVLRRGSVRFPFRRVGVLYDWREFDVPVPRSAVDFWACDAAHLPFADATFGGAVALNLIDCVYSPLDLLREMARVLRPGAGLLVASPYDWTPGATAIEAWVGGHSPRSLGGGASEAVLRALLTPGGHAAAVPGLELVAERDDVPWTVRMHDRSTVAYRLHMVLAARR